MRLFGLLFAFSASALLADDEPKKADPPKTGSDKPMPKIEAGLYEQEGTNWSIKFDGTAKYEVFRDSKSLVTGTYKLEKNEITITDEKGPGANKGSKKTATYKFALNKGKLTFTKVKDPGQRRPQVLMKAAWVLKAAKKKPDEK